MMISKDYKPLLIVLFCLMATIARSGIKLPQLIQSGMVLQRESIVTIWGWADPGEEIVIQFQRKKYRTSTDKGGKWSLQLETGKSGGPYIMELTGDGSRITLDNILLGDVWLCSGQSNMVHNLGRHQDRYRYEIDNATNPEIRQVIIPDHPVLSGPEDELKNTSWKEANPENVLDFTVVGYFFAKHLYDQYQVPIGIIKSAVGGTPIQAWISEDGLKDFPDLTATIQQNKDTAYLNDIKKRVSEARKSASPPSADQGLVAEIPWYSLDYQPKGWDRMNIPGYWEDQGVRDLNGTVWFRKEIEVPQTMVGQPARIDMGRIIDSDNVYINGERIGGTGYQYPQRRYEIKDGILKEGKNLIVVQVTNNGGKGGFVPDKPYRLFAGTDTIDLKGYWQYKVGNVFKPIKGGYIGGISAQNQPSALFNGMIAPFIPYKIKGVLWYQGESNTWRGQAYDKLMKALISDWRKQWNDPGLPVFYAQLPNYMDVNYLPEESSWAELRFSQFQALEVPNTAMAVTLNLGEWNDIHPGNKKPIGDRLALAARNMVYGEQDLVYSGPLYKSATREGNKIYLSFNHIGDGLVSDDGEPLRWFAIAGADKEFVWAEAEIEGDQVIVWSEEINDPVFVRYAWMDNPAHANFFNKNGLPASPFEASLPVKEKGLWNGKKAAVVLTYDDALEVHLDNVIPELDRKGFKGTFYLTASSPGSQARLNDWKRAAESGHELGNHTLYHPCNGEGRDWISPANDLSQYTTEQIVREVKMTNVFLQALDGQFERTFAYTCGDTKTKEGSFVNAIKDEFVALRGVNGAINKIGTMDLNNLNCFVADGKGADDFIDWVEQAKDENGLVVILFHGVGGGHSGNVDLEEHNSFLTYLKEHQEELWITTTLEASKHIKTYQK